MESNEVRRNAVQHSASDCSEIQCNLLLHRSVVTVSVVTSNWLQTLVWLHSYNQLQTRTLAVCVDILQWNVFG
jgi:hypothetical protein